MSENTQAKLDFDSLETTPGPLSCAEEKSILPVPNTPVADKDFDSLGQTPVTERFLTSTTYRTLNLCKFVLCI